MASGAADWPELHALHPTPARQPEHCDEANSVASSGSVGLPEESDAYRLRPDESGYDNLVLAGDWTDNGLNAGRIEAATISGLQAANTVLGRSRLYRVAGSWLG